MRSSALLETFGLPDDNAQVQMHAPIPSQPDQAQPSQHVVVRLPAWMAKPAEESPAVSEMSPSKDYLAALTKPRRQPRVGTSPAAPAASMMVGEGGFSACVAQPASSPGLSAFVAQDAFAAAAAPSSPPRPSSPPQRPSSPPPSPPEQPDQGAAGSAFASRFVARSRAGPRSAATSLDGAEAAAAARVEATSDTRTLDARVPLAPPMRSTLDTGKDAAVSEAEAQAEARAKAREGHAANSVEDFVGARRLFEEAYNLMPDDASQATERATYLFSAANMAVKASEHTDAKTMYERVLALPNLDPSLRTKVQDKLSDPRLGDPAVSVPVSLARPGSLGRRVSAELGGVASDKPPDEIDAESSEDDEVQMRLREVREEVAELQRQETDERAALERTQAAAVAAAEAAAAEAQVVATLRQTKAALDADWDATRRRAEAEQQMIEQQQRPVVMVESRSPAGRVARAPGAKAELIDQLVMTMGSIFDRLVFPTDDAASVPGTRLSALARTLQDAGDASNSAPEKAAMDTFSVIIAQAGGSKAQCSRMEFISHIREMPSSSYSSDEATAFIDVLASILGDEDAIAGFVESVVDDERSTMAAEGIDEATPVPAPAAVARHPRHRMPDVPAPDVPAPDVPAPDVVDRFALADGRVRRTSRVQQSTFGVDGKDDTESSYGNYAQLRQRCAELEKECEELKEENAKMSNQNRDLNVARVLTAQSAGPAAAASNASTAALASLQKLDRKLVIPGLEPSSSVDELLALIVRSTELNIDQWTSLTYRGHDLKRARGRKLEYFGLPDAADEIELKAKIPRAQIETTVRDATDGQEELALGAWVKDELELMGPDWRQRFAAEGRQFLSQAFASSAEGGMGRLQVDKPPRRGARGT